MLETNKGNVLEIHHTMKQNKKKSFEQQNLCGRVRKQKIMGALVREQLKGKFATQTRCPHSRTSLCLSVSPLFISLYMFSPPRLETLLLRVYMASSTGEPDHP